MLNALTGFLVNQSFHIENRNARVSPFWGGSAGVTDTNLGRVKGYVHNYIEVVQNGSILIERGIDISIISQMSFWDALLIAAAEYSNCVELITEDLNDGQIINGVKIKPMP
jgi:predicted nucleic acid-binding protein